MRLFSLVFFLSLGCRAEVMESFLFLYLVNTSLATL